MKTEQVIEYITGWLNDRCASAGRDGFVVGVSGGVDSAATSTLCARTGLKTVGLSLPIHQAASQHSRAARQLAWLAEHFDNVETGEVDLTAAFEAVRESLPADTRDDHGMANARSRLRMLTLYAVASARRLLVAGTGNKVEDFGVGFFTKYGDGGVDLAPIADLLKSEVRAVARGLGIIGEIVDATPTDGLWDDARSDEDQIGASYDDLEWAMDFAARGGDEESLDDHRRAVLGIYRRMRAQNLHKMQPVPVACLPAALKRDDPA